MLNLTVIFFKRKCLFKFRFFNDNLNKNFYSSKVIATKGAGVKLSSFIGCIFTNATSLNNKINELEARILTLGCPQLVISDGTRSIGLGVGPGLLMDRTVQTDVTDVTDRSRPM